MVGVLPLDLVVQSASNVAYPTPARRGGHVRWRSLVDGGEVEWRLRDAYGEGTGPNVDLKVTCLGAGPAVEFVADLVGEADVDLLCRGGLHER